MKEFKKSIEDLAYRHSIMQVFDDLMYATVCAFSYGRMEEQYAEIMKRYDDKEQKQFAIALAELVKAYDDLSLGGDWNDVLGMFFEEYNGKFGRDAMGQFFTPKSVCDLMASITYEPDEEPITICDPSCGSGRNLIAIDRLKPDNRFRHTYFGQDLDRRCVLMCTINMVMYGMKGYVIHMNTITQQTFGGYRIFLPETGLGIVPLTADQCTAIVTEPRREISIPKPEPPPLPTTKPPPPVQMKLFG